MSRTFACLYGFGGSLVAITLLLPGASTREEVVLAVLAGAAYVVAATCILGDERLPMWFFRGLPMLGNVFITILFFTGGADAASAYALFLFWVSVSAFYFFSPGYGVLCTGVGTACYALALGLQPGTQLGALYWVMMAGGLFVAGVLIGQLRARAERLVDELRDAAKTDVLTGVANRREFDALLSLELSRAERTGQVLSVVALDLDGLKRINDRRGHQAGDAALKRVADVLVAHTRDRDLLARLGGDEFGLIASDTTAEEAFQLAERLRQAARHWFARDEDPLTVSAGIATFPTDGSTPDEVEAAADKALYAAKRSGRDCAVVYHHRDARAVIGPGHASGRRDASASLEAMISIAEFVDVRMGSPRHSQTVGRYAMQLAGKLGMSPDDVKRVRLAGLLHDVGKIGISSAMLSKPGPFTPAEWEHMHHHPEIGAEIARNAELLDAAQWILEHHEQLDGGGYPRGLSGDQISLEARILAISDAYEAMTNDRPYRRALSPQQAEQELLNHSGSQFDAAIVLAFLDLISADRGDPVGASTTSS